MKTGRLINLKELKKNWKTKKKTVKLILSLENNLFAFVVGKVERINVEVEMSTGFIRFMVILGVMPCIIQFYVPDVSGDYNAIIFKGR